MPITKNIIEMRIRTLEALIADSEKRGDPYHMVANWTEDLEICRMGLHGFEMKEGRVLHHLERIQTLVGVEDVNNAKDAVSKLRKVRELVIKLMDGISK
jgi:hypothetical protein